MKKKIANENIEYAIFCLIKGNKKTNISAYLYKNKYSSENKKKSWFPTNKGWSQMELGQGSTHLIVLLFGKVGDSYTYQKN